MKVRKTSGNQAGLVVDLPSHAAEAELAFGTAERIEEVLPPAVQAEPDLELEPAVEGKVTKKRSKKSAS